MHSDILDHYFFVAGHRRVAVALAFEEAVVGSRDPSQVVVRSRVVVGHSQAGKLDQAVEGSHPDSRSNLGSPWRLTRD